MTLTIGLDLDGVVFDFVSDFRNLIGRPELPDPDRWEMWECWGQSSHDWHLWFDKGVADGRLFTDPERLYPGAREAVEALVADGHRIHVISHRPEVCRPRTERWLRDVGIPFHELTLTKDKTTCDVDVLIDDNVGNVTAAARCGQVGLLFDQPWNDVLGDDWDWRSVRMSSWAQLLGFLSAFPSARPTPSPRNATPTLRTDEQNEVLGIFLQLLAGPTGDGGNKRARGEKPSWKVDPSHHDAALRHLGYSERYDHESGWHKNIHAAWRLLAEAYQDMVADGLVPKSPT